MNDRPQGEDWGDDRFFGAVSVDDGDGVVLVGERSVFMVAVKLDSNGNELWKWEVRFAHA